MQYGVHRYILTQAIQFTFHSPVVFIKLSFELSETQCAPYVLAYVILYTKRTCSTLSLVRWKSSTNGKHNPQAWQTIQWKSLNLLETRNHEPSNAKWSSRSPLVHWPDLHWSLLVIYMPPFTCIYAITKHDPSWPKTPQNTHKTIHTNFQT